MSTVIYFSFIESPLGRMVARGDGEFVTGLFIPPHKHWQGIGDAWQRRDELFAELRDQLAEYFAGRRRAFDVPIKLTGTPFQQQVWRELTRIPFAATISYAQLATRIGRPDASRAVGHANGRNPISILVPCHRVVGSDGALVGYAAGVDKKRWLLEWERRATPSPSRAARRPGLTSLV